MFDNNYLIYVKRIYHADKFLVLVINPFFEF